VGRVCGYEGVILSLHRARICLARLRFEWVLPPSPRLEPVLWRRRTCLSSNVLPHDLHPRSNCTVLSLSFVSCPLCEYFIWFQETVADEITAIRTGVQLIAHSSWMHLDGTENKLCKTCKCPGEPNTLLRQSFGSGSLLSRGREARGGCPDVGHQRSVPDGTFSKHGVL